MSRFDQEWAVVPTAARWLAVLASLAYAALMVAVFLLPAWAAGDRHAVLMLVPIFLLALLGVVPIALWPCGARARSATSPSRLRGGTVRAAGPP